MVDIDVLRETLAKAETKWKRLKNQADAAQREYDELLTTIRVLERLSGQSEQSPQAPLSDTATTILQYLGFGESAGRTPKEVFDAIEIIEGEGMSADLVRTNLWRLAKRGVIESQNSRYWRPESERPEKKTPGAATPGVVEHGPEAELEGSLAAQHPAANRESVGSNPTRSALGSNLPNSWDDPGLDDDVPF